MGRMSVRSKAPLQSIKNIVDGTFLGVAGGVTTDFIIANAVNDYTGIVSDVQIGCHIKAVWIEYSYQFTQTAQGRMDMYLCKKPGVASITAYPVPGSTGGDNARKFIFLERKGLGNVPSAAAGTDSVSRGFAGWVKIPKRYQRMGENDQFIIRFGSSSNYSVCNKIIYKWKI